MKWYVVVFENGGRVHIPEDLAADADAARAQAIEGIVSCTGLRADQIARVVRVEEHVRPLS